MTILSQVRTPLATALASVSANVFAYVPENIPAPAAVVIVPDSPYMEFQTIGSNSTFRARINMTITCAVAYNSNPASLDNLEQLITSVVSLIPSGYELTAVDRPTVTTVGAGQLLVADIRVATYYTQS
jgi:hypothetical protein